MCRKSSFWAVVAVALSAGMAVALPVVRGVGLLKRPSFTAYHGGVFPPVAPILSGSWSTQQAFPALTFQNPMGLCPVPGTNDLLVWEREGRVWRFHNDPAVTEKQLVVDLSSVCQGWHDSGLMGVAPHPRFSENGYLFLYYTHVPEGAVQGSATQQPATDILNKERLVRYTCLPDGTADAASALTYIEQISETVWHEGGGLFFGPKDGFLYLSVGDDARGKNNQRIDGGFFSGVLRVDVDELGGTLSHTPLRKPLPAGSVAQHYFIPNDNPFVGKANALEEFYAIGLRNPHRMTCDAATGRIFIGDVGEGAQEELNVIEPHDAKGLNFQWNLAEGSPEKLLKIQLGVSKAPLLSYRHLEGRAIIAGYVYRGTEFARDLAGKFIFGDNVTGTVWYLDETTTPATKHALTTVPDGPGPNAGANYCGLSSFGQDAKGEIYLCQLSSTAGRILKLSRAGAAPVPLPRKLSETKLFRDTAQLLPSAALIPYEVNSPLWSDGATKQRWFAVPSKAKIGFSPTGAWAFPEGSVFVKHFELPKTGADGRAIAPSRLETRVLVRDAAGYVYGASYRWRPDGKDADLVETGQSASFTVAKGAKGKADKMQTWYFPGRQDCLTCHTRISSGVLGVNTRQLNRSYRYASTGVTDQQLHTLATIGLFDTAPADLSALAKLVPADDLDEPIEQRARSYLDANCSHCHQPGGVHAFWDARADTPLDEAGIIEGTVNNNLGQPDAKVIYPRDWTRSVLFKRISVAGQPHSMPPLARQRVDKTGVGLLAEWIASMDIEEAGPAPEPWKVVPIGSHPVAPSVSWKKGSFYVQAQCHDIWEGRDDFVFIHTTPRATGQLTARVLSLTPTDAWTKAGIMIRQSTATDSPHATLVVTPGQGSAFQHRATAAAGTQHTPGPALTAPQWLRLRWSPGEVVASVSSDGKNWRETSRAALDLSSTAMPGLCLSGHNAAAQADATFDKISIE